MNPLTPLEGNLLQFIHSVWEKSGLLPTISQIVFHFGLERQTIRRHLSFLHERGCLDFDPFLANGFRIITPWGNSTTGFEMPILGNIAAGLPEDATEESNGTLLIGLEKLGLTPGPHLFALQVHGDSMIGKQIFDGEYAILDRSRTPHSGQVVAALVDGRSTLKTFIQEKNKTYLHPENDHFSNVFPTYELMIQGVLAGLIRKPI